MWFLFFLSFLCFCFWVLLRHHYAFWNNRNVPQVIPTFIVGNLGRLLSMQGSPASFIQQLYNRPQVKNEPFCGIFVFHQPAILIRHPELVKRILVKDFSKFSDRFSNSDYKGDPMGSLNIFFLRNPAWKEVRLRLSPFFSTSKLKQMVHLVAQAGHDLDKYLLSQPIKNLKESVFTLEMKELCALYTTDVIATVAFGVQANSFKNPNGDFRRNGRAVFKFTLLRALEFIMVFFLPKSVPYLGFKVVPVESTNFLRSTINYVMREREMSGQKRNDLIDILIEFKNYLKSTNTDLILKDDIVVAQAALFFTAGFETSSATMAFALYELAKRFDLQQRLRAEIQQGLKRTNGQVTYEFIDSLEYMQMIIQEVLRLYPPLPFLDRQCTVQSDEGYSLEPFHQFRIPQGMGVYVPVYGIHLDPKYFPDPEVFDPERFSPVNKRLIVPYTYMPFGLGPHSCIGERFAMIQTKIGLVNFFRNHVVETCEKTKIPMELDKKAVIVQAAGGIYLNVIRNPLDLQKSNITNQRDINT